MKLTISIHNGGYMHTNFNEIIKELEQGVIEIFETNKYQNYLKICSQYPYSINNIVLILKQFPQATIVKSYYDWKKIGTTVKKNEKGIKIIIPIKKRKSPIEIIDTDKIEDNKKDPDIYYRIGYVFDISQTTLEKAPSLSQELLTNNQLLNQAITDLIKNNDNIILDPELNSKSYNGYFNTKTKKIHIKDNLSDLHTFKTIIHEKAHSILHNNNNYQQQKSEIEAESVAYIVCHAFNFDTSDYSFGYIASYAQNKDLLILKESLENIKNASNIIINWVTSNTNLNLITD